MKKVYWRPRAVSRQALLLIAVISIAGLFLVERFRSNVQQPYYEEKVAATELAKRAMTAIKKARFKANYIVDWQTDPSESGMIGIAMSPVTSVAGDLAAKQTSANPNFAAVVVEMLKDAGVKEGDVVAVGCSGSFPSLNVCTYAACEALKLKMLVIGSAASSQWGANIPELIWLDMERVLNEQEFINTRTIAASIGGYEDRGLGMSDEGRAAIQAAIERNAIPTLKANSFEASIDERMEIYKEQAGGLPIKAYVNIGGGTVSVGRSMGKKIFNPGLNRKMPAKLGTIDGVMPRMARQRVPVIHLIQIIDLAERYGMQIAPQTMPEVGDANVFYGDNYNNWLVSAVLGLILLSLFAFIRTDVGFRLLQSSGRRKDHGHPEPMV
jgi:poly-gamma-glutamate system protein